MWDTLRESSLGQLARLLSRRSDILPFPEELDSFQLPASLNINPGVLLNSELDDELSKSACKAVASELSFFPASADTTPSEEKDLEAATSQTVWDSEATTTTTTPAPTPVHDAVVDWYSPSDPANPQNWSLSKKIWITTQMGLYTFAVYVGSSLYAPSESQVMSVFGASFEAAALGIALYVLGYGVGPLLWSPLSEIPRIGRTTIYIATFAAFVLLALGACVVDSLAGLLVLRFLLGFTGSPCLATAGATLDDMYAPWKLPYVLVVWSSSATLGPALGPIVSGFAVTKMGWRWSGWELFWLAAPVLIIMFTTLPETNADTILHRRAARLRARTGRVDLVCEADRKRAHMTPRQVAADALVKPWQINALDPAVLYTTAYAAVLYATYYSFFEAFPLVFVDMHGFNLGESGLPFLAFVPGLLIAVPGYIFWFRLKVEPVMRRESPPLYGHPESRLFPAVATGFLAPIGLFIFAWTSRPDVHWIAPIVGLMVLFVGVVVSFQCMNFYISRCYPKYSASLFAANTFARSCFAAGSILFSTPTYKTLGVGGGVSLLACLSVLCAVGTIVLWRYGDRLRVRSRFAQSS
ncbi:MFS general substrate transporter [Hypoxylon rubiginosum]|uniref:MFS general substrate transporter n=1 Tax=Hypoxylon rubiginosum TaxID=110542 RepID=A0ACC0CV84_9PEZI|nr:MFS general substrate transporter [Hypoxylon rubiginosum]